MIRLSSIAIVMLMSCGLVASAFGAEATATITPSKAAATQPSNTSVTGTATFTQDGADVKVVVDLAGLSPGKHGCHLHEKNDLSDPELKSVGPHWDMGGKHHHGGPETAEHHAGDLGNLTADDSGKAHMEGMLKGITLDELTGRSVIVHAKEDDLKTDPSGNSGGRVAGGAIEVKK